MVHSVDVQGQFVRTETSSGSNIAPAQPEKTNEQSNGRSAVIALVAGAVGLSPTILWAMPQPGTCAGYYPISPKIWLACDTSNYSKRIDWAAPLPNHAYGFRTVTAVATAAKAIAAAVATPAIVKASLAFACASLAKSKAAFASVLALRAASSSSAFAAFLRSSFLSSR